MATISVSVWSSGHNTADQLGNQTIDMAGLDSVATGGYHTLAIATRQTIATTYGNVGMYRLVSGARRVLPPRTPMIQSAIG